MASSKKKVVSVKQVAKSVPVKSAPKVHLKVVSSKTTAETKPAARPVIAQAVPMRIASGDVSSFRAGDKVVYPGHGVGMINTVITRQIAGMEHRIFEISILSSGMKIMVPITQAQTVGLRKVIDKKAIDRVFTILKDRDFKIDTQTWNRRFREYSNKIKTGSVFEIAEVMRDLAVLSTDKELSFGEKKMLDMAEQLLVSEIAIARAKTEDKVIGEIRALFV